MIKWFSLLLLLLSFRKIGAQSAECGIWDPWEKYKDELCYFLDSRINIYDHETGERLCTRSYDATLLHIRSQLEQDAINDYLFTKHKIANALVGAKYDPVDKRFKWTDGTDFKFTNWQTGYPKNNETDYCVHLNAESDQLGKWIDVPCSRKAFMVCQKEQIWTNAVIKKIVQQLRNNPVPMGFVYVQLPKDASPIELYPPEITWTDVTDDYKEFFFRAGRSNDGVTSLMTDAEVRPRNMTMKVWKRTA